MTNDDPGMEPEGMEPEGMEPESMTPDSGAPIDKDARLWAMLCHLGALAVVLCPPLLLNLVVPLVIWLVKRETHPFVDDQGKEAVNFQISLVIVAAILVILSFIPLVGLLFTVVGILVGLGALIMVIMGAVTAHKGEYHRYPINWRIIK